MQKSIIGAVTENLGPVGPEYEESNSSPPPLALFESKTGLDEHADLKKKIKTGLLIAGLVVFLILLIVYGPKALFKGLAWITNESRGQPIIIVAVSLIILQTIWGVLCIPFISIIEALAGFILGFWPAVVVNTLGLLSACVVSFILGKRFLRAALKDWITANAPKWGATFKVMEREGITFLIMFRFLALPFWAKNYGPAALLDIPTARFALSVLVATCPFGWLYAFLGDRSQKLTQNASSDSDTSSDSLASLIELLVILSIIVASIFVSMKAFRMFQQAEAESNTVELGSVKPKHVLLQEDASPKTSERQQLQV
jgi:uncharacterized membrane protein YdjX (TVP38/TMEM64 family)